MMTRGFVRILAAALCALWLAEAVAAPRLPHGRVQAGPHRQAQMPAAQPLRAQVLRAQGRVKTRKPDTFRRGRGDHDRTLRDYREGRIRPFAEIRRRVQRKVGGRILDAQLDRRNSPWIYRLRVLTDDGQVLAVRLNAQTGRIIDVKGKRK